MHCLSDTRRRIRPGGDLAREPQTETMNQSEQINELTTALSKAQGVMSHAAKETENTFFKSKYATLAACLDAVREPLAANGLSVTQRTHIDSAGGIVLITTLWHSSGQFLSSEYPILPVKNDPQGLGSALTYARRYTLSSITGIAQDDDDGNVASGKAAAAKTETAPQSKPPAKQKKAEKPPVERLADFLRKCGVKPDDIDGMDRIIAWVTDGSYASHEQATATDKDANAVVNAALDTVKEHGGKVDKFRELSATWAESRQLDRAVTG